MAHSIHRRYRYGASFLDQESGIRFEGHHPKQRPDLWRRYLDGADGRYRSRGVEEAFHREELEAGNGVSLFFVAFNVENEMVGGVRIHGPLENRFEAAVMGEMAASSEIELIGDTIERECRLGAIEVKGAWSNGQAAVGHRLLEIFGRCSIHALNWLGAEFAVLAVADRMLESGARTGAIRIGETAVAFPDERYRTVAMSYRRSLSYEVAHEDQQRALRREAEQLARGPIEVVGAVDVNSAQYQSWQPLVLDVKFRAEREVLRTLREEVSLQLIDRYDEQCTQLSGLVDVAPSEIADDGQRWVYYPWRRAVVRLLGPRSFELLRLNRNRNKITKREQSKLRSLRIGVVGASVGHTIAHVLAMEGLAGELRIADFDTIELTNLNRIPTGVADLGVNKAVAAARRIAEIDPYLKVVTYEKGITPDNVGHFLDGLDIVIEECDSLDIKMLVREAARERRIPVIMETSDRGVLDVERFDLEPDRPLFHGLMGSMTYEMLAGLSTEQKGPFVLRILGVNDVSARAAASALELGTTVSGWPQLASEVTLGGASVATAIRRFGLGHELPSGRVRIDIDEILGALEPVSMDPSLVEGLSTPPPTDPPINSHDPVDIIVDAARRAPSGGNVQPWRFEADEKEMRFYLVPDRTSAMDIQFRGSYVGIGAAIFNARVAAAKLRRLGSVELFPDRDNELHVATMILGTGMDPEIEQLSEAIATRNANRKMGAPQDIDSETLSLFQRAVEKEGVNLRVSTNRDEILASATMLAEADRWRFLIPHVHRDMMKELRIPGRDPLTTGLDVRTLEMDASTLGMMSLLGRDDVMEHLREWRGGKILGVRTRISVASSSSLAVFTIPRSDPKWYVRAGEAIERVWLLAEKSGLSVQPVSPLYLFANDEADMVALGGERRLEELLEHSENFRSLWHIGPYEAMAMVLRIFHSGPPTVHSIRLPLDEQLSRTFDTASVEDNMESFQNYGS